LARGIDLHADKGSHPEIGNPNCEDDKDWGEDGGFDSGSGIGARQQPAKCSDHFPIY
jgi:hypothetical protein